jgi:UDP-glucose 4-epimerase
VVPYDEACEEGFEDMPRRLPHIAKIEEAAVGWTPSRTLDEILVEVIDFQRGRGRSRLRAASRSVAS